MRSSRGVKVTGRRAGVQFWRRHEDVDVDGPARQPRGYTQEQLVATCLDARNVPSLPGIPPTQQPQAWALVRSLLVDHVHKERGGKPEVHLEGQSSNDEPDD